MNNLASERTRIGLIKEDAARKLCVSPKTLGKYEKNPQSMPGDFIVRACRLYGCSAGYLLGLSEERCAVVA